MIIFYGIPGNLLLLLAGVMLLGSIIFAVWYAVMNAKEESESLVVDPISTGKRVGVLLCVIAVFASIAAVVYGFIAHNGIVGTIGVLAWITFSLIIAYTCSPLRLISADQQASANQGCAYLLYAPLLAIITTVSMILIMLISWIFGLAAVLKGLSKKVYLIIAVCIVLLIALGVGLNFYHSINEQKKEAHTFYLVDEAMHQVCDDINNGAFKKIEFDEETKLAMEYYGVKSFFAETDVREAIAKKFSDLYGSDDTDAFVEFLTFLDVNYMNFLSEGNVYDICFTDDYLNDLKSSLEGKAVYTDDGANDTYTYGTTKFIFSTFGCYVEYEYILDGQTKTGTEILGYKSYRKDHHETYDENSVGYFLVDQRVELIEDVIENSEDRANKYYPPATCIRCGTSFRANTTYARMIAEHGYCGFGQCGKD